MTLNRLLITSVVIENRPVEVAAAYGVSQSWLYELLARYKTEGEAASSPAPGARTEFPTARPTRSST